MNKDQARKIFEEMLSDWDKADKSTGYDYEKNFVQLMNKMNSELFDLSIESHSKDRNTKKKS